MSALIRLGIGIPTYQRPDTLAKLLAVLPERIREVPPTYDVTVIIIDNSPEASARAEAERWSDGSVRYVHEPRPGIAAARARALAEASDQRLLAFIDDDEVPATRWLSELVDLWEKTGAAEVAGRVETRFPEATDPWVLASGLFERPLLVPGSRLAATATGNLLLDLDQVRALGVQFDTTLGMRGGEDTLFTRTLVARGGTIVACPSSVAHDELEPSRATRAFALERARHHGATQADVDRRLARGMMGRIVSRVRSTVKAGAWLLRRSRPNSAGRGARHRRGSSTRCARVGRALGLFAGAWGKPPAEYERASPPVGLAERCPRKRWRP